jgi:hypothetical protein
MTFAKDGLGSLTIKRANGLARNQVRAEICRPSQMPSLPASAPSMTPR